MFLGHVLVILALRTAQLDLLYTRWVRSIATIHIPLSITKLENLGKGMPRFELGAAG